MFQGPPRKAPKGVIAAIAKTRRAAAGHENSLHAANCLRTPPPPPRPSPPQKKNLHYKGSLKREYFASGTCLGFRV